MIFDSSNLGNAIAGIIHNYLVSGSTQATATSPYLNRVVIGSGTQPTFAQLTANWSTDYYINRTGAGDRKSTRLNSSHVSESRMPSSA